MAYDAKNYVDITGLREFLSKIEYNLAHNTATYTKDEHDQDVPARFLVLNAVNATKATGDANGDSIVNTYLKSTTAASTYVPRTFTIGDASEGKIEGTDYVDFSTPISAAELRTVLHVSDTGEANVLEGVQVKNRGDVAFSDLIIDGNKKVQIDLSNFATIAEVTSIFRFKGSKKTYAEIEAVVNPAEGDVYHCEADEGEYVYMADTYVKCASGAVAESGVTYYSKSGNTYTAVSPAPAVGDDVSAYYTKEAAHWELISHSLSNYYTKSEVYTKTETNNQITAATSPIDTAVKAIYTPAQGTEGQEGYVAASGYLASEITRAKGIEAGLQSAINTLNGNDSTAGSVAKSIKDAIGALDYSTGAGVSGNDYVTQVTETDGVIAVTYGAKGTVGAGQNGLVTGAAVQSALDTFKTNLAAGSVGSTGKYLETIVEANGIITATAADFDTGIGPASGTGAATNNTAPTSAAVRSELDGVYGAIGAIANNDIDALFPSA